MTETEIIELIDERIKAEYNKHKDFNWSRLAAHKILSSLKKYNVINPDNLRNE